MTIRAVGRYLRKYRTGCIAVAALAGGAVAGPAFGETAAPAATEAAPAATEAAKATEAMKARQDEAIKALASDPRFKGLTEQQRRDRVQFVAGNVLFALVHEVGHMLISEMALPVLGREEDAADAFATISGLKMATSFSDRVLIESAHGWFLSDRRNHKEGLKMVFYDEHGLDKQRAYNIVCLMVGSNPEKFQQLAEMTKLPEDRQGTCQGDFSNASWSWEKALEPHVRKADEPKTKIEVAYADGGKQFDLIARGFQNLKMLEVVADYLSDRFVWRRPVGLEMAVCKEPSARWNLSIHKIIVCYELAADFAQLYRDYGETKPKSAARHRSR
jgi:hypothetical protein